MSTTVTINPIKYQEIYDIQTKELNEILDPSGPKRTTTWLRVLQNGKKISSSNDKIFPDCVELYSVAIPLETQMPVSSVGQGTQQSGALVCPPIAMAIPINASPTLASVTSALVKANQLEMEVVFTSLGEGKDIPICSYYLKGIITVSAPENKKINGIEYSRFIIVAQESIKMERYKIGPDNKKEGTAGSMTIDFVKGTIV